MRRYWPHLGPRIAGRRAGGQTFSKSVAESLALAASQSGAIGGGFDLLNWDATTDATGYQVGWSTTPTWPSYTNIVDVGNVLGVDALSGIGTGTRYLAVRAYYDSTDLYDEWSAEVTKTI